MIGTKISAIIVGRNELEKLKSCLPALAFCDEIIYGDLNSSDNSVNYAKSISCRIFVFREFGPSCEYTQAELIKHVKNDWVIMIDPDEVVDKCLAKEIVEKLPLISQDYNIGDIYVPWQFYFGKKRLKGTVWGFDKNKGILINRNKYEILPITHYGRQLKPGFRSKILLNNGSNVLHHYWMDDWGNFLEKHKRYLKDEGEDRYKMGERISIVGLIYNIPYQFINCYVRKKGYKDGWIGLKLSVFWVWYNTISNWQLLKAIKGSKK